MQTFKITIKPKSYFATPLQGDTLFGQLCWVVRLLFGDERLQRLLAGYKSQPFVVVSDAFPEGFLPRPQVPQAWLGIENLDPEQRKTMKRKQWVPISQLDKPLARWMQAAQDIKVWSADKQMHNSINRMTDTAGEAGFAPYAVQTHWAEDGQCFDIYVVLDESQLSKAELGHAFRHIGEVGFGKDASIGAGKFEISTIEAANLPHHAKANAVLTLAATAPQGLELNPERCFYQPFTRYGRHGDWAVLVNPYKTPILLARTAAVLSPKKLANVAFIGQGLGGNGEISRTIEATVHQGYAPVLRIELVEQEEL